MKPLCFFLLAMVVCCSVSAQKRNPKDRQITSRYFNGTLFAKVNFASLLDPKSPTLQVGLEYRINEKLSAEFAVGIPIVAIAQHTVTDSTYHNYYKLRAELHFFPKGRFFYIGPELLFMRKQQSKYSGNVRLKDAHDYNYTYAELEKMVFAFGIKVGMIVPLSEKLNIEGSFSLGPRIVNVKIDPVGLERRTGLFSGWVWPEKEGTTVGIHQAYGAKLSYTIF